MKKNKENRGISGHDMRIVLLCVRVCVRACVRACVGGWVGACVRDWVCGCVGVGVGACMCIVYVRMHACSIPSQYS
jgi:hypothetical protein